MVEKEKKVVRIHDVDVDNEYVKWINEIKARYRSSQIKAAIRINAEQLKFNWMLGMDLVLRKAEEKWGSGIVEQVSLDLQAAFPESKGFSTSNLRFMKQWYLFFSPEIEKLQQVVRELQLPERQHDNKLQQAVEESTEVQYAIKGIQTPIGVSSFENVHIKEIQEQLPTVEELRERIRQIEEYMNS